MVAETCIYISKKKPTFIVVMTDSYLQRKYRKTYIYLPLQYLKPEQSFIILYKCIPEKSIKYGYTQSPIKTKVLNIYLLLYYSDFLYIWNYNFTLKLVIADCEPTQNKHQAFHLNLHI